MPLVPMATMVLILTLTHAHTLTIVVIGANEAIDTIFAIVANGTLSF